MDLLVSWGTAKLIRIAAYKAMRSVDRTELVFEIADAFDDDQTETVEDHADCPLVEILAEAVVAWTGNDVDALFDSLEVAFSERDIEIDYDLDSVPQPDLDEVEGEED